MNLLGVVAVLTAAHGAPAVRVNGMLRGFPASEIVVGECQVITNGEAAGVVEERGGAIFLALSVVGRVVRRVVAVHTVKATIEVDIPGAGQVLLVHDVHGGLGDLLAREHLASRRCVRAEIGHKHGMGGVGLHGSVTEPTVLVLRLLNGDEVWLEFSVFVERAGIPLPPLFGLLYDAGAQKCCRVRPGKISRFQRFNSSVVVRVGGVAQEAVHLHHPRCLPVPGLTCPCLGIQHGRFWVCGVGQQVCQGQALAAGRRGPTSHVPTPKGHHPLRGAQVEPLVAWLGEIAVEKWIPATKGAIGGIPRFTRGRGTRLDDVRKAHVRVITV